MKLKELIWYRDKASSLERVEELVPDELAN